MSAATDETAQIDDLVSSLQECILQEAEGGPTKTIDLNECEGARYDALLKREDTEIEGDHDGSPRFAHMKLTDEDGNQPRRATFYIAVDLLTRHYGGPQEGGWWYNDGEIVTCEAVRVSYTEDGKPSLAQRERDFLRELAAEWLEKFEFGTCHRSSMHPRGDDFAWRATQDTPEDWSGYAPYC